MQEPKPNASETETSDSFVAVDIDNLAHQLVANTMDHSCSSSPRIVSVMKKNLSRKGSQGSGAERETNKTGERDQHHSTGESRSHSPTRIPTRPGGPAEGEKRPPSVHVAIEGEAGVFARATAPTPDGGRWRRVVTRRPSSPWLDPGRVVITFATLSSMGTLILLYFTLSMGKMTSGHENAR